jgi:DNA-binding NarL/FixJ family response regulator
MSAKVLVHGGGTMSTTNTVPQQRTSTSTIDVVVIDDHRTFADLLALALAGEPDMNCVGTADSVEAGLCLVESVRPDVVVMDVQIGDDDGILATARLIERHPTTRVVVLTAHADRHVLNRASDAGACALLPKDGSLSEMLSALRTARRGGLVVHPQLLRKIVGTVRPVGQSYVPPLTRREHQVLQLLADGLDARTVSKQLDISLNTCRGYIKSLLLKLEAHSQLEAVAIASRNGLVRVRAAG